MRHRSFLLMFVFLAGACVFGQTIASLENAWQRGDYAGVLPKLIDYRDHTGKKTPQIDYMIATSACRVSGKRQLGAQFFSWILYNYNLSPSNRATIESEQQHCTAESRPQRLQTIVPAALVGVTYHGKGGTEIRPSSSGNGTTEVIKPIPSQVFAARLFPIDSAEAASVQIRNSLGAGTRIVHQGHFLLVVVPRSRQEFEAKFRDPALPAKLPPPQPPNMGVQPSNSADNAPA